MTRFLLTLLLPLAAILALALALYLRGVRGPKVPDVGPQVYPERAVLSDSDAIRAWRHGQE